MPILQKPIPLLLTSSKAAQYWALTKPRVTQLAVFCAVIGMFLATDTLPSWKIVVWGCLGIWLLAAAAFAMNCLIERKVDARMRRTAWRASASGEISTLAICIFSLALGLSGMIILYQLVNPLTAWMTFATFVGYAVIYTIFLKPHTPQNIVIGGLSGAMPPALGWAAVTGDVPAQAWILVLIIFVWTPPHFWTLALYRFEDYQKSGLPMLPVTHGQKLTLQHIFLYSILLVATTIIPFAMKTNGWIYLMSALILGGSFLWHTYKLMLNYSDKYARKTFRFSIVYLALLFMSLLIDHWVL
ncbi:MAG: heme o synthase [Burkholderiaceae bacterium]|nr:heme o synthase [Burkholderiaceae bacterium]